MPIYSNIYLKIVVDNICCYKKIVLLVITTLWNFSSCFNGKLPSELNLIFLYLSSYSSEPLFSKSVIFLIYFHVSSYFLTYFFPSSIGTLVRCLLLLWFSTYPFILLKLICKDFTLPCFISNEEDKNIFIRFCIYFYVFTIKIINNDDGRCH